MSRNGIRTVVGCCLRERSCPRWPRLSLSDCGWGLATPPGTPHPPAPASFNRSRESAVSGRTKSNDATGRRNGGGWQARELGNYPAPGNGIWARRRLMRRRASACVSIPRTPHVVPYCLRWRDGRLRTSSLPRKSSRSRPTRWIASARPAIRASCRVRSRYFPTFNCGSVANGCRSIRRPMRAEYNQKALILL